MADSEDAVERGPEGDSSNYVRNVNEEGLFYKELRGLRWTCYTCFDEVHGTELCWISVQNTQAAPGDAAGASKLGDVLHQLQAWSTLDHPMILKIRAMWLGAAAGNPDPHGSVNVVTEMLGRPSLRTYRQLHTRLGFPAIQKLSRQLFKLLTFVADHTELPVHQITSVDIQVQPSSAKICLLPLFIWRTEAGHDAAPPDGGAPALSDADDSRARLMLRTFVVLMLELFTGSPQQSTQPAALRDELRKAELPSVEVRGALLSCVPDGGAPLPAASELLESVLLDSRRFWNVDAAAPAPQDAVGGDMAALMSRSLQRRFSTIGMGTAAARVAHPPAAAVRAAHPQAVAAAAVQEIDEEANFAVGRVKGLDYETSVSGVLSGSCLDFTVKLTRVQEGQPPDSHLVRFPFDLNVDVVDQVASELGALFGMDETDVDITAAAMKEVIASVVPDMQHLFTAASRLSFGGDELPSALNSGEGLSDASLPSAGASALPRSSQPSGSRVSAVGTDS